MDETIKLSWDQLKEANQKKRSAQKSLRIERSASQELCNHFQGMQQELREFKSNVTGYVKRHEYDILEKQIKEKDENMK